MGAEGVNEQSSARNGTQAGAPGDSERPRRRERRIRPLTPRGHARSSLLSARTTCHVASAERVFCIDTYRAFNGVHGLANPSRLLEPDHTHPNETGHQLIASLLEKVNLVPHGGPRGRNGWYGWLSAPLVDWASGT